MTSRTVHFSHGSQMWFIRETDHEQCRERETKRGWYNCSDAEDEVDAVTAGDFEAWTPIVHHGIWPAPIKPEKENTR